MSDTPLLERLQVKRDRRLAVLDAPGEAGKLLAEAPMANLDKAEVVLLFAADQSSLERVLANHIPAITGQAVIWVAYPKLSSSKAADLSRDIIRTLVLARGLDTLGQIAIDDDWSALRLKRTT